MVWTALMLGFAGSLHCLGMCSPLMITITRLSAPQRLARIVYNFGRIFTYGVLGSIIASMGLVFPLMRFQNLISVALGVFLVIIAMGSLSTVGVPLINNILRRCNYSLKTLFSKALVNKNFATTFLLGLLNGLLPCGISFLALMHCLTLAGALDGFQFMLVFGVGTLPVMLGFSSFFQAVAKKFQFSQQRLINGLLILSGTLLIARVFLIHPQDSIAHQNIIDIVLCR